MLIKMKRTQVTAAGRLAAGVAYDMSRSPDTKKLGQRLVKQGFAVKTDRKTLAADAESVTVKRREQEGRAADAADTAPVDESVGEDGKSE